jgi:multicomponent Na+:H+ antiporter subunit E
VPARRAARSDHTLRPLRLATFLAWFAWQLVLSNLVVAREVVTPRDHIRTGIVRVPLSGCSDLVVTVIANAISLTPGTLTLEARHDPPALYVHVLHLYDIDSARRDILTTQRLVVRAIGSAEAIAALADEEAAAAAAPPTPPAPSQEARP